MREGYAEEDITSEKKRRPNGFLYTRSPEGFVSVQNNSGVHVRACTVASECITEPTIYYTTRQCLPDLLAYISSAPRYIRASAAGKISKEMIDQRTPSSLHLLGVCVYIFEKIPLKLFCTVNSGRETFAFVTFFFLLRLLAFLANYILTDSQDCEASRGEEV